MQSKGIACEKALWQQEALMLENSKCLETEVKDEHGAKYVLKGQWKQGFIDPCKNFSLYPKCNEKLFKYLIMFNVINSVFQKYQGIAKKNLKKNKV